MFFPTLLLCVGFLCLNTEPASAVRRRTSRRKIHKPLIEPKEPPRPTCDPQEYLLFDFTTAYSVEEVKHLFSFVRVLYAFKVTGAGHYLYIVLNDHSQQLKELYLPDDAQHYAQVIPMETLPNFLGRFGVDNFPSPVEDHLHDKDLGYIEKIWLAQGLTEDQYRATIRDFFTRPSIIHEFRNFTLFFSVGYLPTRCYIFFNENDCKIAESIFNNVDPSGTFGNLKMVVRRITNVH